MPISIVSELSTGWQNWHSSKKVLHFLAAPHLWHKISYLEKVVQKSDILQPFPKVAKFVLSHVLQGINLESLEPPRRKFFPWQPDSADLEMSNSMSTGGWVVSPLLGCKESHLPFLKADRRVSVPCHMLDSLQDWEFQENIGFSRKNINFSMTGKVTRL